MLDLALLSANAAQLKYIIATGNKHNYHILLLCLVSFSICLQVNMKYIMQKSNYFCKSILYFQVLQAVVCIILGLVLDISKVSDQKRAIIVNNVSLVIAVIVGAMNVVISAFDIKSLPEVA